jgi:hypothetical protein
MADPRRTGIDRWAIALVVAGLLPLLAPEAHARARARRASAAADDARQVTLFGIVAMPNSTAIDPKLVQIADQLRKVKPNHGFKLLEVRSKRLAATESVACDLGNGYVAATELVKPLDLNGKVQLRCTLSRFGDVLFNTLVTTPPNQLFFCDKPLDDGTRLLIGIGAR